MIKFGKLTSDLAKRQRRSDRIKHIIICMFLLFATLAAVVLFVCTLFIALRVF